MNNEIKFDSGEQREFTEAELNSIENFGSVHFSPEQIAVVLLVDCDSLKRILSENKKHPAFKRYHKGRLQSEYNFRVKVFDLAERSSPQAQDMVNRFIDRNKIDLTHD